MAGLLSHFRRNFERVPKTLCHKTQEYYLPRTRWRSRIRMVALNFDLERGFRTAASLTPLKFQEFQVNVTEAAVLW